MIPPPAFRDTDPDRGFPTFADRVLIMACWTVFTFGVAVVIGLLMLAIGII